MRVISNDIFVLRYVFPAFFFAFLIISFFGSILFNTSEKIPIFVCIIPIVVGFFGFFMLIFVVWDLVDEVVWEENVLTVKKKGIEDTIHLADIQNVSVSMRQNPKRITLSLSKPSKFGTKISFCPLIEKFSLNPFSNKCELADELIAAIQKCRESSKQPVV